jgi:hypothetical protein
MVKPPLLGFYIPFKDLSFVSGYAGISASFVPTSALVALL